MTRSPPQIPHRVAWDRTRTSTFRDRQLTAWVVARQDYVRSHASRKQSGRSNILGC